MTFRWGGPSGRRNHYDLVSGHERSRGPLSTFPSVTRVSPFRSRGVLRLRHDSDQRFSVRDWPCHNDIIATVFIFLVVLYACSLTRFATVTDYYLCNWKSTVPYIALCILHASMCFCVFDLSFPPTLFVFLMPRLQRSQNFYGKNARFFYCWY